MSDNRKSNAFSSGFTTAGGRPVNVSDKALLKAKNLFTEELDGTDCNEEALSTHKENNESDAPKLSTGFQTASSRHINVSNEALLKAKTLFYDENVENTKYVIPSVSFKTASGSPLIISNEALSRAKQQFEDDREKQLNELNMYITNNDFEIASDQNLIVPKEALENEEKSFSEKSVVNTKNVMSSIGFKKASGSSISVSEKALLKAKQLFTNDLEDTDKFKESVVIEEQTNEPEMQMQNIGFQTARGQNMSVTADALLKAKELYDEQTLEGFENNSALPKSLQKRKIKDLDDDISLNEKVTTNHFKKLRFSHQLQVQETSRKNWRSNEEKKNQTLASVSTKVLNPNYHADKSIDINCMTETNERSHEVDDHFLISHEIEASAVALLADEKSSDSSEQWISLAESKQSDDNLNVPSSPVIGGNFISKKRKSLGKRKKSINGVNSKENKSINVDNTKQLNNNCVPSDQYVKDESKLLIENHELKSKEIKSDISVTNEFGDSQLMIDFINQSASIIEKRLEAALEQERQITLKKRNKPKPIISKLYFHKKSNCNNRVSWREISKGNKPFPCTSEELIQRKLPPEIFDINADNAVAYKFRCTDFYGQDFVQNNIEGIKLEDGTCLILDENGYAGKSEIKRSLLASPGVDPNLLPAGWVENHYKWIVWKLASMDRIKLGSIRLPRALTPARVMMELKYRYDREIDMSQRSALKKILEKDDVASKRMVLCVSSITECDDSAVINKSPNQLKRLSKKLILTDGWYSIQASVDQTMIKHITSGKIKEGTKLMTYGSELLNCDKGWSPLEIPENVSLKIHTNSTRRAKWDTRLGYIVPSGPMCIKLRSICPNGGLIGKIRVLIARVYPILYHEKTSAGKSIFRNARCEEKANIAYENECRSMIKAFYAKAEKYFSTGKRMSDSNPDSIDLAAYEWNEDREKLSKEEFLSKQEQEQLVNECRMKEEKFKQKLESRLQESLPPPRQVTQLLKIRIIEEETTAIFSIWSSNEEITDGLKEGSCISICNIMPSGKRGNELQLTASRNAKFNRENVPNVIYPQRTYTALCDVNKASFAPMYGEFDTVGIVVSVGNEPYGMKNFEAVHLAYPYTNSQSSYLSILFWDGLASHGYTEILTTGSFVACSNIEWRQRATPWNIPMAYCTERSTFTRNPRQSHLHQPFSDLKRLVTDTATYVTTCATEISEEVKKKSLTRLSDQNTPDRNNIDKVSSFETFNSDKQCGNYVSHELQGRNSTCNQTAKSMAIQKRLEKLQYYGEPSNLSPIVLNNSSKRVLLDFQSPIRSSDSKQSRSHTSFNSKSLHSSR